MQPGTAGDTAATTPPGRSAAAPIRRRITARGTVQGVGFRPFIWRRATRLGLSGWVENDAAGVTLEIEGSPEAVSLFLKGLAAAAPALAAIRSLETIDVPAEGRGTPAGASAARFVIRETRGPRGADTDIPADVAPCPACRAEIRGTGRRAGYPFTNCTDCGPRATIITGLPYDRRRTTMRAFAMCADCAREHAAPADRRFHAEPIACPACGPTAWFAVTGPAIPAVRPTSCDPAAAIAAARDALARGLIVAVKGVGGFHLMCDATSSAAVAALRARKRRPGKPFAVMVESVAACIPFAHVDPQEERLLDSRERPIVLLRRRAATAGAAPVLPLAPEVAPGNDHVGVLLPPSPLHDLLCAGLPPLVATSGNVADDPILFTNADAVATLAAVADAFLLHDRDIAAPCDDSVARSAAGTIVPIRRGRGHAPLTIQIAADGPPLLAVGGDLKTTVCVAAAGRAILGPHLGDAGSPAVLAALDHWAEHLLGLCGVEPRVVVADLHPRSLSAAWAARFAGQRRIQLVRVQHHEAHVAALMTEHGIPLPGSAAAGSAPAGSGSAGDERPLIAACFDGTGYGHDGTIWGGEFFIADRHGLRRAAHLEPFALPGGDASVRHPWRTAAAVLHAGGIGWEPALPPLVVRSAADCAVLRRQLDRGLSCATTSSMGRLFDAVASLAGGCHSVDHEAAAAMRLEALAREHRDFAGAADADDVVAEAAAAGYRFTIEPRGDAARPLLIGWRSLVAAVARDAGGGVAAATIAARFHAAVAGLVVAVSERLREEGAAGAVGLTGGVFQNAVLLELSVESLRRRGFDVLLHHSVPANDGGLALGQAMLARGRLSSPP